MGRYKNFIDGMREHEGVEEDEIDDWFYAGGGPECAGNESMERHYNYWCMLGSPYVEHKEKCVCGKPITYNCYITDKEDRFIVVGSCCIKDFMENNTRTCEICDRPHRNRKDNYCNICRDLCKGCFINEHEKYSNFCRSCVWKKCRYCGYEKNNKWWSCYKCNQKKKNGEKLKELARFQ